MRTAPLWITCLLVAACSPRPHEPSPLAEAWRDHFERNLAGSAVGYAYVVQQHGVELAAGEHGYARRPSFRGGSRPMTRNTRMQIAGISETITTVALLHALERTQLPLETPLASILPRPLKGQGECLVTVEQLLARGRGANTADPLCRAVLEAWTGRGYADYVRAELLTPVGAGGMSLSAYAAEGTHAFRAGDPSEGTPIVADVERGAPAPGWYATARELAAFLGALQDGTFLSTALRERMLGRGLGVFSAETHAGPAWYRDGRWVVDGGRGVHACIALFPDGVSAVLLLNTDGPFPPSDVLMRGYEACLPRVCHRDSRTERIVHAERPAHVDTLRYTTDGSVPDGRAAPYAGAFRTAPVNEVRVRGFRDGTPATLVATVPAARP